jgi:hypothetical protein
VNKLNESESFDISFGTYFGEIVDLGSQRHLLTKFSFELNDEIPVMFRD